MFTLTLPDLLRWLFWAITFLYVLGVLVVILEWSLEEYQRSPVWRRLLDSVYRLASPIL